METKETLKEVKEKTSNEELKASIAKKETALKGNKDVKK